MRFAVRAFAALVVGTLTTGSAVFALDTSELPSARQSTTDTVLVAQARDNNGGSIVVLEPPRQDDYRLTIVARDDGVMQIDGFVPDDATRKRLAAMAGVDARGLSLARGEPQGFGNALDFGLAVLGRMSEGRFEIRNGGLRIEGRAATPADYAAIEALVPPQGFDIAMGGVRPALADPFVWEAVKAADGRLSFSGFVPSEAVRRTIADGLGATLTADTSSIADGVPDGFEKSVAAGLSVLAKLPAGTVRFDGETWTLDAVADTTLQAAQANTAFRTAGLEAAGWTHTIRLPEAEPAEIPPEIAEYAWAAEKLPAGTIALSGFVPTDGLRRVLLGRAGAQAVDQLALGSGAPDSFPLDVIAALDALRLLDEGRAEFADGTWSITGRSDESGAPDAVTAALGERAPSWQIAVTAPPPAPPPPPLADPFTWSATRTADGAFSFAGHFATPQLKSFAAARVDNVAADTAEVASGAPDGFVPDVVAALDALLQLAEGEVSFDGAKWSLTGAPETAQNRDAALAALATAATPADQWAVTLAEPPAPPVEEVAEPAPVEPEAPAEPETEVAIAEPAPLAVPEELEPEAPAETAMVETPEVEPEAPAEVVLEDTQVAVVEPEPVTPEPEAPATEVAAIPEATPAPIQVALAPEPIAIPDTVVFDATRVDGNPVSLSGSVPAGAARSYFGVIAGKVPTDKMVVAENLPADFIPNADAGIRVLTLLDGGRLAFDGTHWYLSGTANSEAEREAATQQALITLPPSGNWRTSIGLTPPLDRCRDTVAGFAADHPILFQSGSARMTDESVASLGELAGDLGICPDTAVYIEGHTDADGPDELNLALSVARAEAVVDALVELGVGYQRLYAVGYGESLPIADNETAAGKRANRRIVFNILEDAE